MTLKEKFKFPIDANNKINDYVAKQCEKVADEFAIGFAQWKDDNFLVYNNKTYYAKTSSKYFDVTKYIGKEKPTKYYILNELLEIYKQ
jgi:hypothetical protein